MSDPAAAVLSLEPADLDGHTIDELEDYLDRDRQPADASIDNSPSCQIALGALQRLRSIAATYLNDEDPPNGTDEDWIGCVLAVLPVEVRRGQLFPIAIADPAVEAHITEGALRGLIRATGDAIPGLLIGAIHIELAEPEPAADITVDVALVYGTVLADAEHALRRDLHTVLSRHAPFSIRTINIRVRDLIVPRRTTPRGGQR